jgi:hypothetical protein
MANKLGNVLVGTNAERPTADGSGRLYAESDTGKMFVDTGTWVQVGGGAPGDLTYRTGSAEVVLPILAAGNNLSHANGAWSAWDQHIASTAAEYYFAGACVVGRVVAVQVAAGTTTVQLRLQQELGKGAAASEVVINKAKGFGVGALVSEANAAGTATAQTPFFLSCEYPLTNVAASTRVAIRGRADGTGAVVTGRYYLFAYPSDIQDHLATISLADLLAVPQETRTFPDQTVITLTSAATSWGDVGAFTEINASIGADYLIEGIGINPNLVAGASNDWQIEVATGAAGAEVVRARAGFPAVLGVPLPLSAEIPVPFPIAYRATSGDRLSAKVYGSLALALSVDVRLFVRKVS